MKRTLPAFPGLFLIAILAGGSPSAEAHPGHAVPIDELTRASGLILEGTVTSVSGAWNDAHNQIYTTVAMDVAQVYKGAPVGRRFSFSLLGGTVGDMTLAIVGQASFAPNERVFLFMSPDWTRGQIPVLGGEEGRFRVVQDARTGVESLEGTGLTVTKSLALGEIRSINAAQQ